MSVSISNMIEANNQFEVEQLKDFEQFINTSKELKGALKAEEVKAQQNWDTMQSMVEELEQPVAANNENPMQILESDTQYVAALDYVRILPPDLNQPKQSIAYINAFQKQVDEEMKQREKVNE